MRLDADCAICPVVVGVSCLMHCASISPVWDGLGVQSERNGGRKIIEVASISLLHVCQNTTQLSQSPFHPPDIWGVLFWSLSNARRTGAYLSLVGF